MDRGSGYVRPRLYRESVPEQLHRHSEDLSKVRMSHTLRVVKDVTRWFDNRRLVGEEYKEPDCVVEATSQCRVEGVIPEHISAAVGLITDIYFHR